MAALAKCTRRDVHWPCDAAVAAPPRKCPRASHATPCSDGRWLAAGSPASRARPHVARPHVARPHVARPPVARPHVARPHVARPRAWPHVARPPNNSTSRGSISFNSILRSRSHVAPRKVAWAAASHLHVHPRRAARVGPRACTDFQAWRRATPVPGDGPRSAGGVCRGPATPDDVVRRDREGNAPRTLG